DRTWTVTAPGASADRGSANSIAGIRAAEPWPTRQALASCRSTRTEFAVGLATDTACSRLQLSGPGRTASSRLPAGTLASVQQPAVGQLGCLPPNPVFICSRIAWTLVPRYGPAGANGPDSDSTARLTGPLTGTAVAAGLDG